MSQLQIKDLRVEAEQMFYHGYDNYMKHAFPEDELRPLTCAPLTRDRNNPAHIELNDALGNYSLTLIDSLSTLAIMSSQSPGWPRNNKALRAFQDGIKALVEMYGDGTPTAKGEGIRARGFDVDSKVQVFETVIRGVGGLLSAHLFAIGELPIAGYDAKAHMKKKGEGYTVKWSNKFKYNGQLLRLADNLARRLLPAFATDTGLPYPRVNLRYGVPFYANSPLNQDAEMGECPLKPSIPAEITETCSAGAGSLVLEFTVLSRLTGDPIFEQVAKRAFWSIWERRSSIGLVGAGIDAESGQWTSTYTGIGAGIDSFYEYAAKASILLSGTDLPPGIRPSSRNAADQAERLQLVTDYQHTAAAFGEAWQASHDAIKRHLYRGAQYTHGHYVQGDLFTGAARAYWIDSLSAFYPGLLAMFGELDEGIESHLLYTALWTRFSALPERWSLSSGGVESGLGWWGGRPEFVESTYHIYQATKDPWYLHVGEMVMRDIKRRCWTKCGFSGIQDVRSGDKNDRMESFFLGETTKYLYLLYSPDHPLNKLDAPYVFTTEGHPLIIPRSAKSTGAATQTKDMQSSKDGTVDAEELVCRKPPLAVPFSISATAARGDVFHAAKLARLHMMPTRETLESPLVEYSHDHPSITVSDVRSPSNFTYFPWTLPLEYIPHDGTSSKINVRNTFDVTFPTLPNTILGPASLQRVGNGLLITSMSGLRLGMVQDAPANPDSEVEAHHYRIQTVNHIMLGRDERVFIAKSTALQAVQPTDPNFTTIRDPILLDLVVDLPSVDEGRQTNATSSSTSTTSRTSATSATPAPSLVFDAADPSNEVATSLRQAFSMLLSQIGLALQPNLEPLPAAATETQPSPSPTSHRMHVPAILPTGPGAAPLPDFSEAQYQSSDPTRNTDDDLIFTTIFFTDEACTPLARHIARQHQIIVLKRGGCSFVDKLSNIPTFAPAKSALQLVIVVSYEEEASQQIYDKDGGAWTTQFLTRPALDGEQVTGKGLPRRNPIPMVLVTGGEETYEMLKRAKRVGIKRKYEVRAQGVPIRNLVML